MDEQQVKIVRIKGQGAGVLSMTDIPLRTWEALQKEARKDGSTNKDILDWVIVPNKNEPINIPVEVKEPVKSPEEILKEAMEATAPVTTEKEKKAKVESKTKEVNG